jgi:integrase
MIWDLASAILSEMAGKQAKVLSEREVEDLLFFAETTRYPDRNRVIVVLSVKAGLRAGEIANLTWQMVVNPTGTSRTPFCKR